MARVSYVPAYVWLASLLPTRRQHRRDGWTVRRDGPKGTRGPTAPPGLGPGRPVDRSVGRGRSTGRGFGERAPLLARSLVAQTGSEASFLQVSDLQRAGAR